MYGLRKLIWGFNSLLIFKRILSPPEDQDGAGTIDSSVAGLTPGSRP